LVDAQSGSVLYEKNAEQRHLIASTTKILTALIVLERAEDLDATVTIPSDWTGVEGSSMYLEAGDVVSIRGLLYGLLLNSGNDAATVLAQTVAGDEATFVEWMNEYAAQIGMADSHFANPHGLDADDHYSTAHDMARLMIEAMKNETFREITHTRYINIDGFELYFHNKLLNRYQYCISGKTGYTVAAGRTLVTESEKDGQLLVAVTLNAPDDWNDQIAMYEYGYANAKRSNLCTAGACLGTVSVEGSQTALPVYAAKTITYLVRDGDRVSWQVCLPDSISQSVHKGAAIGWIEYTVNGQSAGKTDLIAGAYVTAQEEEVSCEWRTEFKRSCLLAGLYPDAQPNGTYRMEGLLSTAYWHNWG
jgi:D-alanyl-D-alanine carboxypeptidase